MSIFEKQPLSRHLQFYEKVALGFSGAAFLLFVAVLYFSLARATIHIVANPTTATAIMLTHISPHPQGNDQVGGFYVRHLFTQERRVQFEPNGSRAVEGRANGKVTIVNKSRKDQPLVATTRFLSPDGVLFRLQSDVVVKAGTEVTATLQADQPGKSGEIGPTTFTIPGLAASLQKDIYGVSSVPMVGGLEYVRVLTQEDVDGAIEGVVGDISKEAAALFASLVPQQYKDQSRLSADNPVVAVDTAVGAEVGAFTITVSQYVSGVYYDADALVALARNALEHRVPLGYRITEISQDSLAITIDKANEETGDADVTVNISGQARVSEEAPLFERERFLGRSADEVQKILLSSGDVSEVSVTFMPFWLKRIPTLADHVRVEVK